MRRRFNLLAGAAALPLVAAAGPAFAGAAPCIVAGSSTGCQYLITINPNGSTTIANETATNGKGYFIESSSADVEVGVVNNSKRSVSGFFISHNGSLASFDGEGIDTYGAPGNAKDKTGYGGPDSYFTHISSSGNSADVNFVTPLTPGSSTYFSLGSVMA